MKKLVMAYANDYDSTECFSVISSWNQATAVGTNSHLGDMPAASREAADIKTGEGTKTDTIQVIICLLKISFLCLQPLRRVLNEGIHSVSQSDQAVMGMNSTLLSQGKSRWR